LCLVILNLVQNLSFDCYSPLHGYRVVARYDAHMMFSGCRILARYRPTSPFRFSQNIVFTFITKGILASVFYKQMTKNYVICQPHKENAGQRTIY